MTFQICRDRICGMYKHCMHSRACKATPYELPDRDPRWESVSAWVNPHWPSWEGEEQPEDDDRVIEIGIEVTLEGMMYYNVQRVFAADMDLARVDVFKLVLDQMVDRVDQILDEAGVR